MLVLIGVAGLFALGVYLQPLDKHSALTRVGGYSEREFGWNKPQQIFPSTKLDFPSSGGDSGRYGSYHDVVVLGDSFSWIWPEIQWQNHLAATTGWSVATLSLYTIRLEQILSSQVFRNHPPRVLIFESVERSLTVNLRNDTANCGKSPATLQSNRDDSSTAFTPSTRPDERLPGATQRVKRERSWSEIKLDFVRGYIWHSILRKLSGDAHAESAKVELIRPAPFSSRNQHAILVSDQDLKKVERWKKEGIPKMVCRIQSIRRQVEANGYTRFVLMVPPDKLTIYADFVRDEGLRNSRTLGELSGHLPEVMPRLDQALISAVREEKQDVYLPDDTHWGSNGSQIAAETLLNFLRNH
jgi:SGNH hydrolase-like domain, acetyltransferase AlgX